MILKGKEAKRFEKMIREQENIPLYPVKTPGIEEVAQKIKEISLKRNKKIEVL